MEYIALDVHKKYTWARVENIEGARLYESRLAHAHGTVKNFVHRWSHGKAKVAVARHLSEASFWMLKKGEPYREPMSSTQR